MSDETKPQQDHPTAAEKRLRSALAGYRRAIEHASTVKTPGGPVVNIDVMNMQIQTRVDRMQLQLLIGFLVANGLDQESFHDTMAEKQQRIWAVKNFWHNAKQVGIGSVLDVDISLARDLRGGNKAEWVQADTLLVEQAPPQRPPPEEPEGTKLLRVHLASMIEDDIALCLASGPKDGPRIMTGPRRKM